MIRLSLLMLAAAAGVVSLSLFGSGEPSPGQASHGNVNVHVHDTFFHPEGAFGTPTDHTAAAAACQLADPDPACDAQIHAGDTITWITAPPVAQAPHSVTECTDNTYTVCGANVDTNNPIGDTGFVFPNQWPTTVVQFTTAGTYYYRCDVHLTNMRGRVVVAQAPSATPSPTPAPTPPGAPSASVAATAGASPTVTPARIIGAGGSSESGGGLPWYLFAIGAGILLVTSTAISLKAARR